MKGRGKGVELETGPVLRPSWALLPPGLALFPVPSCFELHLNSTPVHSGCCHSVSPLLPRMSCTPRSHPVTSGMFSCYQSLGPRVGKPGGKRLDWALSYLGRRVCSMGTPRAPEHILQRIDGSALDPLPLPCPKSSDSGWFG